MVEHVPGSLRKGIDKWDRAASSLDMGARGEHVRYGHHKYSLFAKARGRTLLVAAGTGLDFRYLPPSIDVTAVDFSSAMLERAANRIGDSPAAVRLTRADVTSLPFDDGAFDTVLTSCTFCSVRDPVKGLRELRRTLADDGALLMFEHVRCSNPYLGFMMDLMNPVVRKLGPEINRKTGENIRAAGFRVTREYNVYLDMVKLFEAAKA